MQQNTYTCECGRVFTKPNSFNGHKSHCKEHLVATGNWSKHLIAKDQRYFKVSDTLRSYGEERRKIAFQKWLEEKHVCEKCGKVMITKYGSGRFCSRKCSNSRVITDDTKNKIKTKALLRYISSTSKPKVLKSLQCCVCGKYFFAHTTRKTCSDECLHKLFSLQSRNKVKKNGGNINPHPNKRCKSGYYKGIHYDSSWELAFLIYNLEHNIKIERNKESFEYYYNNEKHLYYPDFIIDGEYYEIKNYYTTRVQAKIDYFPKNLILHLFYKKDINHCLDYCISKYGNNFWNAVS